VFVHPFRESLLLNCIAFILKLVEIFLVNAVLYSRVSGLALSLSVSLGGVAGRGPRGKAFVLLVPLVVVVGVLDSVSVGAVGPVGRGRDKVRGGGAGRRGAHVLRLRLAGLLLAVLPARLELGLEAQPVPVVDARRVGHGRFQLRTPLGHLTSSS